jgi:predicted ATP-grasp superfamily ATP-dependent carboligase
MKRSIPSDLTGSNLIEVHVMKISGQYPRRLQKQSFAGPYRKVLLYAVFGCYVANDATA